MDYFIQIQVSVLRELISKKKFGGAHIPLDKVIRRTADKILQDRERKKLIEEAIKDLINKEWVFVQQKRTGKGSDNHISINPRSISAIMGFLRENN